MAIFFVGDVVVNGVAGGADDDDVEIVNLYFPTTIHHFHPVTDLFAPMMICFLTLLEMPRHLAFQPNLLFSTFLQFLIYGEVALVRHSLPRNT